MKYFQQSLTNFAESLRDSGKAKIREACEIFLFKKLLEFDEKNKEWVLDYLCSGK